AEKRERQLPLAKQGFQSLRWKHDLIDNDCGSSHVKYRADDRGGEGSKLLEWRHECLLESPWRPAELLHRAIALRDEHGSNENKMSDGHWERARPETKVV